MLKNFIPVIPIDFPNHTGVGKKTMLISRCLFEVLPFSFPVHLTIGFGSLALAAAASYTWVCAAALTFAALSSPWFWAASAASAALGFCSSRWALAAAAQRVTCLWRAVHAARESPRLLACSDPQFSDALQLGITPVNKSSAGAEYRATSSLYDQFFLHASKR